GGSTSPVRTEPGTPLAWNKCCGIGNTCPLKTVTEPWRYKSVNLPETGEAQTKLATGIDGLDEITLGGFLTGSIYIVRGTPGAGKTILANQICFHWARQGERCLYITLLSESHDRLIENLRKLDFFSPDYVECIHYQSGFHTLDES